MALTHEAMVKIALCAVFLWGPTLALAADFQVKGRKIGDSEKAACGSSVIKDSRGQLKTLGVPHVYYPVSTCEVVVESLAGVIPMSAARLLFWEGRLIRLVIEMPPLDLEEAFKFHKAWSDLHGKPSVKKSYHFASNTWISGKTSLALHFAVGLPSQIDVFLTDEVGWGAFERARERAEKALDLMDKKKRNADILN